MRNVTGMLALGALALAGFSTVTALGLARDLRAHDAGSGASAEALAALEARLGALEIAVMLSTTGVGGTPPALPHDARPPAPPTSSTGTAGVPTALAPAPKPVATMADMERRLAELERQLAKALTVEPAAVDPMSALVPPNPDAIQYVTTLDEAEKHLELTSAQKSDMERVIADTAREREALHRLPGEDGKSWEETAKEAVRILGDGMIQFDGERLAAFRERQIPGRAESFGAADRRLTEAARRRIEEGLSPEQRKRLEKTNVDGLVGGGSGFSGTSISFTATEVQLPLLVPQPAGGK